MADLIQIGINVDTNADQASKSIDRLQGSVVNNLKTVERLEKNYKILDRALNSNRISAQKYAKGVQQVDAAIEQVLNGTQQATKATNQYANATRAATGAMNQYGKVSAVGGKNLNRTNMMIQQAGYQFQDFAVQVQGGTNAFVALGQQGSQLLGIFGAKGAVLGAILAVGTAIARMGTSGKEMSFDFKGFGQAIVKSFEPIQPALDGLVVGLKFIGQVAIEAANLAINAFSLMAITVTGLGNIVLDFGKRAVDAFRFLGSSVWGITNSIAKFVVESTESSLRAILEFANSSVAAYVGLKDSVVAVFGLIPSAVGDLTIQAVNGILQSIENLLNSVIRNVNTFLEKIDAAIPDWMKGDGDGLGRLTEIDIAPLTNKFAGAASNAGAEVSKAFTDAFGREFVSSDLPFLEGFLETTEKNIEGARREAKALANSLGAPVESVERLFEALKNYEAVDLRDFFKMVAKESEDAGNAGEKALSDAKDAAQAYADALDNTVVSAVGSVSDAWADFVMRGFKDFKGFVGAVLDSFKNMIAQMIAMAAKNRIMLSLGIGGVAPTGAMAGSGLLQGAGILGGGGAGIGAAMSGVGSGIAGIMSGGGLGASFANLGGLMSGSIGGLGAIGAAIPAVAAIALVVGLFSKKVKELDSGLRVTVDSTDTLVESYRKLKTSRLFGLMKKQSTQFEEADEETAAPITKAVADVQASVVDMASALGIGSDAFSDFSYQFQVSLKGLSEEEALVAIQQEFANISDAMADLVPDLMDFAREGETSSQVLKRLSSDLLLVNNVFKTLGRAAESMSIQAADAASRLVSAAGGQSAFVSKTQTLVGSYLDPTEQLSYYQRQLEGVFEGGLPSKSQVKGILQEGSLEDLETLYGGDTIQTLGTIFQLQDQIAAEEKARKEEAQRKAQAAAAAAARAAKDRADAAKRAAEAAAKEQQRILDERLGLEEELLKLQGNTAELRRRELEALDPTNRALQEMIWKLEDAKEVMDGISESDFATLFDYQRAVAMARVNTVANNPQPVSPMPAVVNGSPTVSPDSMPSGSSEGSTLENNTFVRQSLVEIIKYSKRTSDTLRKFDNDGLPPERT